eukprot:1142123-Pelagomonas_calceolata.AAC.2
MGSGHNDAYHYHDEDDSPGTTNNKNASGFAGFDDGTDGGALCPGYGTLCLDDGTDRGVLCLESRYNNMSVFFIAATRHCFATQTVIYNATQGRLAWRP